MLAKERLEESIETVVKDDSTLKICVYGRSLDAYTTVQGLLGRGISGSRIVRVVPTKIPTPLDLRIEADETKGDAGDAGKKKKKNIDSDLFGNDEYVTNTVETTLTDAGVVRVDGKLIRMTYSDEDGRLMGGTFNNGSTTSGPIGNITTVENNTDVAFDVMIFCHTKDVDADIFLAANESGLVYDGRLVVDGRFQTADASIFAGGTLTKFSRRYGRTRPRHERFNSLEVGVAVSQAILEDVDPLSVPVQRDNEGQPTCPDFFKPRGTTTILPGGLFFTHIECCPSPGRRSDEASFVSSRELVTNPQDPLSKVSGGRGLGMKYCRLVLDEHRRVASITYLGNESIEDMNFSIIVGMQESYLNSLEHFFDKGTITDLIKFLRGDWAVAVYHDRFRELCMNLSVSSESQEEIQTILTTIRDAAEKEESTLNDICTLRSETIGVGGSKLKYETRRTIELQMLDFLRTNRSLLPMFFLPEQ